MPVRDSTATAEQPDALDRLFAKLDRERSEIIRHSERVGAVAEAVRRMLVARIRFTVVLMNPKLAGHGLQYLCNRPTEDENPVTLILAEREDDRGVATLSFQVVCPAQSPAERGVAIVVRDRHQFTGRRHYADIMDSAMASRIIERELAECVETVLRGAGRAHPSLLAVA